MTAAIQRRNSRVIMAAAAAMVASGLAFGQPTKLAVRANQPREIIEPPKPKPVRRTAKPAKLRTQDDLDSIAAAEAKRERRAAAMAYRVSRGANKQTATPRVRASQP